MGGFRWGCLIGLACGGGDLDAEPVDGGQQCAVLFPGGLVGLGVDAKQGVDPVAWEVWLGGVRLDAGSGGVGVGAGGDGGDAVECGGGGDEQVGQRGALVGGVVPPRSWRTSYAASRLRAAVS